MLYVNFVLLFVGQVMGFSAEQVSGFVALIGILSMMAQVSYVTV